MGIDDRFWDPIEEAEAASVLGPGTRVLERHRRWLFAVSRCRVADGRELYLKRQPPMERSIEQVRWQHRLTNHLADRGVPAARGLGLVEHAGCWYELFEPAAGSDIYAGADSWDPFARDTHVAAAGAMLARLHRAGADFRPLVPQPQAGFVVQLGLAGRGAVAAVEELCRLRPAVADYLAGADWRVAAAAAYDPLLERVGDRLERFGLRPLHGDWQTNNLFFDGDRLTGVIDFHQADCGPRLLDLAVAVERNCFFWNRISAGQDAAYDLRQAALLVDAYDAVEPLSGDERAAFPEVLAACQFEYGISFLDYYWGVEHDREKADWAWHTFVLGHARWWSSAAGRAASAAVGRMVSGDR
jgi:Ser/Thr protein kinase RdoA (MazF antagonist)